jgi:hypothetical protein
MLNAKQKKTEKSADIGKQKEGHTKYEKLKRQ